MNEQHMHGPLPKKHEQFWMHEPKRGLDKMCLCDEMQRWWPCQSCLIMWN